MADPVTGPPSAGRRSVSVPSFWRIVLLVAAGICAVIVLRNVFVAAHRIIGWAIAAAIVAMLLDPIISRLDRRMPRGLAIATTFLFVAAAAGALAWLYSASVTSEIQGLQENGPEIAEQIEARDDRIGTVARDVSLVEQVTELTDRLEQSSGSARQLRSAALSAPAYFVSMILTVFLLIFGPTMVQRAIEQLPDRQRQRTRAALGTAIRHTQVYVWASVAQGVIVGFLVGIAAMLLDVPAAGLLAIFAGVVAMLPYLGIAVAWLPCLVLALGTAPGYQVAVAAVVGAALQVAEALWWRRRVDRRSVHVGPAIPTIVAVIGFAIYGVGGALYGCVLIVLLLTALDELAPGAQGLPTPIDDVAATPPDRPGTSPIP